MRAIRAGLGGFRRPIFAKLAVKRTQEGRQKYLPCPDAGGYRATSTGRCMPGPGS